jgi:perosamine synthetase
MIPVSRPRISQADITSVIEALKKAEISGHSKGVEDFESRLASYLKIENVVAVSSGTTALDLSVEALEIRAGDHCVVPSFTIVSTIAELARRKAKVTLIDADPLTWSIDISRCIDAISAETRLVVPVHIYGLPVNMSPLLDLRERFHFSILEDAAEALGVEYKEKQCGTFGDISIFSFYANKLITTGEGGAIATSNNDLACKIRALRNLNFSKSERFVHDGLGYNSRMNNLSAQLGISQLFNIEQLMSHKLELAKAYSSGLQHHPWITLPLARTDYGRNKYWVYGIVLNQNSPYSAKSFQEELSKRGIDSRRFFCPIHLQPFIGKYDFHYDPSDMKVSENLWEKGLYLPLGTGITISEVEKVIEVIWEISSK